MAMKETFKIELGEQVKDSITGFKGTVTARVQYITGCNQYLVTPKMKRGENKAPSATWYDEDRLLDSVKRPKARKPIGGPQHTPPMK